MDMYYLVLDADSNVVSVTLEKLRESTDKAFPIDYLNRLGFSIAFGTKSLRIHNLYVNYKYDADKNVIVPYSNLTTIRGNLANNLRSSCDLQINEGFTVMINESERFYRCSLTDQLAIMQSVVIAKDTKSCEIKCEVGGDAPKFVTHSLEDCEEVLLAMSKHVLEMRKRYTSKKNLLETSNDEKALSAITWSR